MYNDVKSISTTVIGIAWFVSPILYMLCRKPEIQKHAAAVAAVSAIQTEKEKRDAKAAAIVLEDYEVFNLAVERFNSYSSRQLSGNNDNNTVGTYEHQVAGHTREVIRTLGEGLIMKPMMKKDLFLREVALYEEMNSTSASYLPTPLPFVPDYYGVTMAPAANGSGEMLPFMVLRDLNHRYRKPCVIDIKMGQQTYEPTASAAKISRELHKYPHQEEVGFRVTGHKVLDILSDNYRSFGKKLGRNLHPSYVKDCLASFVYNGLFYRRDVVVCILQQLQRILRWMRRQTRYHFYCSSILIVYDGNVLRDCARQRYLRGMGCRQLRNPVTGEVTFDDEHLQCRHFVDKLRCRRERVSLRHPPSRRAEPHAASSIAGSGSGGGCSPNRSVTNSIDESTTPTALRTTQPNSTERSHSRASEASTHSDGFNDLLLKSPLDLSGSDSYSSSGTPLPAARAMSSNSFSARRSRCNSNNSTEGGAGISGSGSGNVVDSSGSSSGKMVGGVDRSSSGDNADGDGFGLAGRLHVEYFGHDDNAAEQSYKQYLRSHPTLFLPQVTDPEQLVQVKIIDLAHSISSGSDAMNRSLLPLVTLDGNDTSLDNVGSEELVEGSSDSPIPACTAVGSGVNSKSRNAQIIQSLDGTVDHGYVHGLVTLIKMFEDIVVAIDHSVDGHSLTEGIAALLTADEIIGIAPS